METVTKILIKMRPLSTDGAILVLVWLNGQIWLAQLAQPKYSVTINCYKLAVIRVKLQSTTRLISILLGYRVPHTCVNCMNL